jgi:Leucine-rich repeat (LRR) protein
MNTSTLKKRFSLCMGMALFLALAGCGSDDLSINPSLFADPNLELAVAQALNVPVEEITVFSLKRLLVLDASGLNISDLSGLEHCVNLYELTLSLNSISELGPISGLTNLTWLALDQNELTDIGVLANLTSLNILLLSDNGIADLQPLAGLTALTALHLETNQVTDISSLSALINLRQLLLNDNQISGINVLQNMTLLEILALTDNLVSDILPLVNNAGLGSGDRVYLQGNPLSATSCSTHIPALEARDVVVLSDCP